MGSNPISDKYSLLIGNHNFSPDCDVKITKNYLNFLEQNVSTHLYCVIMLGDFNVPKYDWINDIPLPNCYYYSKIKGNFIHATSCFLGLYQHNNSVPNSALLNNILTNINNFVFIYQIFLWLIPITIIPYFILILN
jgi:hypothetical protein